MEERKKKIAIIAGCSTLLVALVVVGAVVVFQEGEKNETKEVSTSQKAISTICETTDHPTVCLNSLEGQNTSNPKELIEVEFKAAIEQINEAAKKSVVLRQAQSEPRAKSALDTCNELANRAMNDLQRSYAKFNSFDITGSVNDILLELKIWLSGSITYQETCLDGFQEVPGDSGQKMRQALNISMQMTSNSLAMVAELATYLESMSVQDTQNGRRRLLSWDNHVSIIGHVGEFPNWMDFNSRRLLTASPQQIRPNLIVAKDGSGQYKTINEALKNIPKGGNKNRNKTFVLYIKEGVYEEKVVINNTRLMIIGDGANKTKITGKLNFVDGTNTFHTATVAVQGDDFIARDIAFENTAGPEKHQAVALRVSADKAIFFNCRMDGYQDTLYAHTYRQFYRDCTISGTIDFIFGDSAAVFQGCTLVVRKPADNQQCIVTAQGRKEIRQPTALVLQNCTIKADPELYPVRTKVKTFLGRPWKEFSRTIIMESFLDDLIQPEGWLAWDKTFALDTLFYTEFNNRGPAAPKSQRVKWGGIKELPPNRVQRFTAAEFLDGNKWIQPTQLPYAPGFIFPVPKEDPNIKYSPVAPEENKDLGSQAEKSSNGNSTEDSSGKKKDDSKQDDSKADDSKQDGSESPPPPPPPPPSPPPPPATDSPPLIPELNKTAPALIIVAAPEPSPSNIPESDLGTSPPVLDGVAPATSPSQPDSASASNPELAPNSQPNELGAPNSISPSMAPSGGSDILSPDQSNVVTSAPASLPSSTDASPSSSPQSDVQALNPVASPPMPNEAASAFSPLSNEFASPPMSAEAHSASPPTLNEAATPSPFVSNEASASPPTPNEAASPSPSASNEASAFPPKMNEVASPSPSVSNETSASPPTPNEAASPSPSVSNEASASPPTSSEVASASPPASNEASASPPTSNGAASAPPVSNEVGSAPPPLSNEASASPPTSNEAASPPPMSNEVGSASSPVSNEASASPPTSNEASSSPPTSNEAGSVSSLEAIEAVFASPPASNKGVSASPPASNEVAASPPASTEDASASPPVSTEGASASPPTSPSGSTPANSSQADNKELNVEKSNETAVASPPISTTSDSGSTQSNASASTSPPPSSSGSSISTPQSDVSSSPPNNPSANAELNKS